ncbi:MAG: T9SS type A sorting domain-containing protein [Bacteroidota bacterium]
MKKAFLFSMLAFLPAFCFCQDLEWTGNLGYDSFGDDILLTARKQIVAVQKQPNYDLVTGFAVLDSAGNEVARIPLPIGILGTLNDIFELPDSSLAVLLNGWQCDVSTPPGYLIFDKDWNVTAASVFFEDLFLTYDPVGAAFSSGEWVVRLEKFESPEHCLLQKRSTDGNDVLWEKTFPSGFIEELAINPGDSLLIFSDEGLLIFNAEGEPLDTLPGFDFARFDVAPNGYGWLRFDSLHYLASDFTEVGVLLFPGDDIVDYFFSEDKLAVLTDEPRAYLYDLSLQLLNSFTLTGSQQYFKAIALREDDVLLAGDEIYGEGFHSNSSLFVKSYTFDGGTTNYGKDAGVIGVAAGQLPTLRTGGHPLEPHYFIDFKDITVQVKNYGSDTLNDLTLRVKFYPPYPSICPQEQIFGKAYQNLQLAPEEDTTLSFNDFFYFKYLGQPDSLIQVCFWTAVPDDRLDAEPENDTWCEIFLVNDVEEIAVGTLKIFPNPASDLLRIQLDENSLPGAATLRIFNAAGQLMQTSNLEIGEEWQVGMGEFAPGFYFLEIEIEGKSGRYKFVKR